MILQVLQSLTSDGKGASGAQEPGSVYNGLFYEPDSLIVPASLAFMCPKEETDL